MCTFSQSCLELSVACLRAMPDNQSPLKVQSSQLFCSFAFKVNNSTKIIATELWRENTETDRSIEYHRHKY